MKTIIRSILDSDLYKFSMQKAVCKLYPRALARYEFINRGDTRFPKGFDQRLCVEIEHMSTMGLTVYEKLQLPIKCPYLDPAYIDFLAGYRFNPSEVDVKLDSDGRLHVVIEGPWYRTILWEVPLLAAISELYYDMKCLEPKPRPERRKRNQAKGKIFSRVMAHIAEFGTRRRFSYKNQVEVIKDLLAHAGDVFIGTSNVHLAIEHDLKPIGTQAHEWFMFMAGKYGYRIANQIALQKWIEVYAGDLGIVLSDTFTSDAFFRTFGMEYAKLFDGVRHDSGNPYKFAQRAESHYRSLGINPASKTIVFSDSLNPRTVEQLEKNFEHLDSTVTFKRAYGIGTNLTNDVGLKPLNIVIKMTACMPDPNDSWLPVVKLSDDKGKYTGDAKEIKICKQALGIL